jgi:DNA-binding Lrp family transcriptional regulator
LKKDFKKEKMINLLRELIKDSSKSDRDLAKILGVSQPTVSRMRKKLVDEEMIIGYSIFPNFYKMGYRILAITFVNLKQKYSQLDKRNEGLIQTRKWMMGQPNVIFCDTCRGMNVDGGMISFHKSYEDFDNFMNQHNIELEKFLLDSKTVLFNLGKHETIKPFHFKYLAEDS